MCNDRCSEPSMVQVLFRKPGKLPCPYVCDNGIQSLRLNAELSQPGSPRKTYFANREGNFRSKDTSYKGILATDGQVSNGAVAVSEINNNDGIGAGQDIYTQYCGNGANFPPASAWVSFENMYDISG